MIGPEALCDSTEVLQHEPDSKLFASARLSANHNILVGSFHQAAVRFLRREVDVGPEFSATQHICEDVGTVA